MNRLWWLGIALALVLPAKAVAVTATLSCRSRSAPVLALEGMIPGRDGEDLLDLKLTRGKATRVIQGFINPTGALEDKGARGYVIDDFEHQVFAIWVVPKTGAAASLKLYAMPSSVKATIGRSVRATFQALLTTPKPEHVGSATAGDMIWNMPMSCTYNG